MYLRTLVGAHAGEVRDYAYLAAQTALRDGMAEPVTVPGPVNVLETRPAVAVTDSQGRRRAARRE